MEESRIIIHAEMQRLILRTGLMKYASDTVNYVKAEFSLGRGWQDFDAVQTIWKSRYDTISVVLDEEGCCMVPQEVLARRSRVQVNLVGFTVDGGTMTARLTSYPALVLDVDAKAELSGAETAEITPSQFEQYVGMVSESARSASESASAASASAEQATESATSAAASEASASNSMVAASSSELAAAESALSASGSADLANASAVAADESAESASADADRAETARAFLEGVSAEAAALAPGSQATASYGDGVFSFGIPQGNTGNGIASAVLNSDYTLTLTFTDGTSYTTPSIRGEKGEQGDAGEVDTAMSGSSALPVQNKVIKAYVDGGLSTKADASSVPTKVSDLTNDAGYLTSYTETDPTVPSWAKASSKPSYTASEVGAVPTTRTVNGKALSSNITLTASDVGAVATETDPVFTSSAAYGITTADIDHWDSGLIEFDTSAPAGTTDGDLYALLTDWGWADCIV